MTILEKFNIFTSLFLLMLQGGGDYELLSEIASIIQFRLT